MNSKISFSSSPVFLVSVLFCLLQTSHFVEPASCVEDVEGRIQLDQGSGEINNGETYRLLQVCLFGQWSYVCKKGFDDVDLSVVLHELEHAGGDYSFRDKGNSQLAFITNIDCTGVERRLMDCPIGAPLNNRTNCGSGNNNKIVEVSVNNHDTRPCENGELEEKSNILYICVSGTWRTLCPKLWRSLQAKVACRQLNPGKVVIDFEKYTKSTSPSFFKYHFICDGNEKQITDCVLVDSQVNNNLCSGSMVIAVICIIGYTTIPTNLTLRAVSSSSVEVNWIQPVSVPPQYRVSNHSITCTSSHGVYTTTSQHVTTPAVDGSTHIHTIISGLMSNTFYTCCVSAHSELGTSESVCDTVITTDKQVVSTVFLVSTVVQVVQSCTIDIGTTPCDPQAKQSDGTPLPWVGGVIIGAVLSTVILFTVLAAVCLWRRKRTHSQHKLPDKNVRERSVSLSHTNDMYNRYSGTPQPYEEYQSKQMQNEPEYSYATHAVETNTYDIVPHQSSSSDDGCNTEGLPVVDNTALYSMCAGEDVQENGVYSKLNRK